MSELTEPVSIGLKLAVTERGEILPWAGGRNLIGARPDQHPVSTRPDQTISAPIRCARRSAARWRDCSSR